MGEALFLGGLSLIVGLACLGILLWTLVSASEITLDNLLLMAICLALAGVFSSLGAAIVRSARQLRAAEQKAPAAQPSRSERASPTAASSSSEAQRREETKVG